MAQATWRHREARKCVCHAVLDDGFAHCVVCFFPAQCKQGTYSSSGLETCESCPLGTYQPEFGSRSCLRCPETTTTVKRGAVDISACGGYHWCLGCLHLFTCQVLCAEEGEAFNKAKCPQYAKNVNNCLFMGSSFFSAGRHFRINNGLSVIAQDFYPRPQ